MNWMIITAAVILGVIAVDQISKIVVSEVLYNKQVTLIEDVLDFTYVENRGMAFGLLEDHRWVFIVLSIVGLSAIGFYLFRYGKKWLTRISLALILGGGVGNMIDRVRLGFVIDFIDFCALPTVWVWVFNIADAAVCVGAALFILDLILDIVREMRAKKADTAKTDAPEADDHGTDV
ncbi:MAG: signal peptidase II [Clostridia bacterium]|nr:signal peptidase II [Clostridia bacterium]